MTSVAGWTPPSFHPDGSLTAVELLRQQSPDPATRGKYYVNTGDSNRDSIVRAERKRGRAKQAGTSGGMYAGGGRGGGRTKPSSDAANFQWGNDVPSCAVVFGGLNSMYVNPEVWILPLRWREKTVQFSPPPLNSQGIEGEGKSNGGGSGLARLGFASMVSVATSAAAVAAAAREKVAAARARGQGKGGASAAVDGTAVDEAWRLWQSRGAAESGGSGIACNIVEGVRGAGTPGSLGGDRQHRRASLPAAGTVGSALVVDAIQRQNGATAGGGVRRSGTGRGAGGRLEDAVEAGGDGIGMAESAAEIEVGLYVAYTFSR